MPIAAFDHVNIRTRNLKEMMAWYTDILGLTPGPRPPFPFGGAWMYLGDQAFVHLVDKPAQKDAVLDNTLEHFAFRATDMAGFVAKLKARGIDHSIDPVPEFPIVQVNFRDPDGNHIHVDFNSSELAGS